MSQCVECTAEMISGQIVCSQCGHWHRRSQEDCRQTRDFLDALRERSGKTETATYMREHCPELFDPSSIACSPVAAPLSPRAIEAAERSLGFALPDVVRLVYTHVGNGGFGPGYGLYGLGVAAGDNPGDAIDAYAISRSVEEDRVEYPGFKWPAALLEICDWGCAEYSYVLCSSPKAPVYSFNYNGYDPEDETTYFSDITSPLFVEVAPSFQLWLEWWIDGTMRF